MRSPAPRFANNDGVIEAAAAALGDALVHSYITGGEVALVVERTRIVEALRALRDTPGLEYQQLMDIAGVDYPDRDPRFEVVYCLLSLTRNHRLHVHVRANEDTPVPSATGLWPFAGWPEREVYDMFGVLFEGHPDLRRILTDYGFKGHPFRKDFPLTGYVEMRYSEEAKRVVYQPVSLAQDFRSFDFMSPWEGAEYILPGDEKGKLPEAKGAPTPLSSQQIINADAKQTPTANPAAPGAGYGIAADTTKATGAGQPNPGNQPQDKPKDPDVIPSPGQNK